MTTRNVKRQAVRAIGPVRVVDLDRPREPPWLARDIAASGLFVLTEDRMEIGTTCRLEITAASTRVSVKARVVRHTPEGMGLCFDELEPHAQHGIAQLLLSLFRDGAGIDEKRGAPRLEVTEHAHWSSATHESPCRIDDISFSGALLSGDSPLLADEIRLTLAAPQEGGSAAALQACSSMAKVVRLGDRGFAVRFLEPSPEFLRCVMALRRRARTNSA